MGRDRNCIPSKAEIDHSRPVQLNTRLLYQHLAALAKLLLQILPTVHDGDDLNVSFAKLIQNAVLINNEFAQGFVAHFWNTTAHLWMLRERLNRRIKSVDNNRRILWRRPLKVVPSGLKIGQRFFRPDYVSH